MYFVYILRSAKDGNLYTGYTNDIDRRFAEHTNGENRSTRWRRPLSLIYYEAYGSQDDAKSREYKLKHSLGARTARSRRLPNILRRPFSVTG